MKMHVVIEQDEAGYYVAEVPALPGCLSQGKKLRQSWLNSSALRPACRINLRSRPGPSSLCKGIDNVHW